MTPTIRDIRRRASIAITSGKGGVGKTNVVINLGVALARLRHRVAIVDADFGLGNVDVLLGLAPTAHLGAVLSGEARVDDILMDGPSGVKVMPAGSGVRSLTALTPVQWDRLNDALEEVADSVDFLLIDTASGVSDNVIDLLVRASRVLVVTSIEPTAVVDAYAVIKLISTAGAPREIGLLVNNAVDAHEAELVFAQLQVAAERFLHRRLIYFGFIPHDPAVRESVLMQRAVVEHLPQAAASRSFRLLAARLSNTSAGEERGLRLVARPARPASGPEAPQCA
jgi:flagellar biosynthesis protein FlhG